MIQRPVFDVLEYALSEVDPSSIDEEFAINASPQNAFSRVWDSVLFGNPVKEIEEIITEGFESGVEALVLAIVKPFAARGRARNGLGASLINMLVVGLIKLIIVVVESDKQLKKRLEGILAKLDLD